MQLHTATELFSQQLGPQALEPGHQQIACDLCESQDVARDHGGVGAHAPVAAGRSDDAKEGRHKHHSPTQVVVETASSFRSYLVPSCSSLSSLEKILKTDRSQVTDVNNR